MTCSRNRRGFTLIELISVMAIILLLGLMVFAAVQRARSEASRAHCLSNLRQMVLAAYVYANDHNDFLPPAYQRDFTTGTTTTWESHLWSLGTAYQIHQCPAFHGKTMWKGDPYAGYNYNASYVGGNILMKDGVIQPGSTPSAMIDEIVNPEQCALFGDGEYKSGANKFMRSPYPGPHDADASLALAGTQGFRHRGRTNIGFADGHVESSRARFDGPGSAKAAPGCGFLSADNSLYDLE